jgi:hypothetical protein
MRASSSHSEYMHARTWVIGMRAVAHQTHIEDAGQQRIRRVQRWNADHDRPKATDLVLPGHWAAIPRRRRITGTAVVHQCEPLALGILESQRQAAVSLEDAPVRDLGCIEALDPPLQGGLTLHPQTRPNDAARASSLVRHRPIEEREVGTGTSLRIGVEQVVSTHVVLINTPFDQAHTECPRVEAVILFDGG